MSLESATSVTHVNFTENAAKRVFGLIQEENDPSLKLRVYIEGGGCSGFQYGFTFDDAVNEQDIVISRTFSYLDPSGKSFAAAVELLIDHLSFQYLIGAEIDYIDDVSGERFIIRNPNAATTCGCGSSFSI